MTNFERTIIVGGLDRDRLRFSRGLTGRLPGSREVAAECIIKEPAKYESVQWLGHVVTMRASHVASLVEKATTAIILPVFEHQYIEPGFHPFQHGIYRRRQHMAELVSSIASEQDLPIHRVEGISTAGWLEELSVAVPGIEQT